MGSLAAMGSIDRVLEVYGEEIKAEFEDIVPESIRPFLERVDLDNNLYGISVSWVFSNGGSLPGPEIDIETLTERYQDCTIVY